MQTGDNISPHILIAQDSQAMASTSGSLDDHQIVRCLTYEEAVKATSDATIDLFLIGAHFDESRAVDLVKYIRNSDEYSKTPIVMVRLLPSRSEKAIKVALQALVKAGAVNASLELEGVPDAGLQIKDVCDALLKSNRA